MDASKMEQLGPIVAEVDGQAPGAQAEAQQQAQAADLATQQAEEWGMLAFMVGGALSMLAPELRRVYTKEACIDWGTAMVPVAEKYGWNGPSNVPELGLAMATMSLAVPSVIFIRARLAELKAKEADKPAEQTPEVPGDGG